MSTPSEVDFRSSSAPPPRFRSSTPGPGQPGQYYVKDIDINNHPYSLEHSDGSNNHSNHVVANGNHSHGNKRFLSQVLVDTPDKRQRPVSAAPTFANRRNVRSVQRTSSYKEARKVYNKALPRRPFDYEVVQSPRQNCYRSDKQSMSKLKPSLDYKLGDDDIENNNDKCTNHNNLSARNSEGSRTHVATDTDSSLSGSDLEEDISADGVEMLHHMKAAERDQVLAEIIDIGDRVLICCPQKPPRYGKKRGQYLHVLTS